MVPFHTNFYQNFHANDFSRERAKRKNNVAKIGWDTVVINFLPAIGRLLEVFSMANKFEPVRRLGPQCAP